MTSRTYTRIMAMACAAGMLTAGAWATDPSEFLGGDLMTSGNWTAGLPGGGVNGLIEVDGTFSNPGSSIGWFGNATVTIDGGHVVREDGNQLIRLDANGYLQILSGSMSSEGGLELNRSGFEIHSGAMTFHYINFYGTGSGLTFGGSVYGGSVTANEIRLYNYQTGEKELYISGGTVTVTSQLRFTGGDGPDGSVTLDGGGTLVVDSTTPFDGWGDGYIDFRDVENSTAKLIVRDYGWAEYEALFDANRLRFNGGNEGRFTDHFFVMGEELILASETTSEFLGGDVMTPANWTEGLPGGMIDGLIQEDGTFSAPGVDINWYAGATVTIDGGNLSRSDTDGALDIHTEALLDIKSGGLTTAGDLNFAQAGLEMSGGSLSASAIRLFGSRSVTTTAARITGGQLTAEKLRVYDNQTFTSGYITFGGAGSLVIDSAEPMDWGDGYINFLDIPGSTASLTIVGYGQAEYEALYASNRLRFDGDNSAAFSDRFQVTGSVLTLADEPAGVQSYEQWVAEQGIPEGQRGVGDDPYGTGLPNLIAYTTGLEPDVPDQRAFAIAQDGEEVVLKLPWRTDIEAGAYFEVESSTNLVVWSVDTNLTWGASPLDDKRVEWKGSALPAHLDDLLFFRILFGLLE
jgi:hypothetical protein